MESTAMSVHKKNGKSLQTTNVHVWMPIFAHDRDGSYIHSVPYHGNWPSTNAKISERQVREGLPSRRELETLLQSGD